MLYSIYVPYDGMADVPYDAILEDAAQMHPVITMFVSDEAIEGRRADQGEAIGKLRAAQAYATIPMELYADSLMIDLKQHPKRYVHFSVFGRKDK